MRSIAIFFLLLFAGLFSVNVIAQQPGSSTPILEKQRIKYKVYLSMLAENRQMESIYTRKVSIYSTGDSSIIVSKSQKWFYPDNIPTEMIPVELIWEVRAKKRGGGGKGILIGAGVGLFLGGLVGAADYQPCTSNGAGGALGSCFLAPNSRSGATLKGALSGFLLGIPIGAILGFKNTIRLKSNHTTYLKQREKLKRLSITGQ